MIPGTMRQKTLRRAPGSATGVFLKYKISLEKYKTGLQKSDGKGILLFQITDDF